MTFCHRRIDQHLSDASRDLATLTFNLGGHSACCWCGSSCSVCLPRLKFVGLPVRKILRTSGLSISRPGDLDLWLLTLKLVRIFAREVDNLLTNFDVSKDVSFSTYRPAPVRCVMWPCDLDLWPWRSRLLSLMRVFVLRLCTKFEVRVLSRSEDIRHLVCEH